MGIKILKERWPGRVLEMAVGREPNEVKVGGDCILPFLHFEGAMPNRPVAALEVWDIEPPEWNPVLAGPFAGVLRDPAAWAKKCADYGADMICLKLAGTHPDFGDATPEEAAATAKAVAESINLPLIVVGCGIEEKDAATLPAVGEALAGKNVLLGCATANNYKDIAVTCIKHGHNIIASSPLDINLAKQLNILINEVDLPLNRVAMDPLVGPLGYGIEYAYSIMERTRLGALSGDKMLASPVICFAGQEVWKTKEAGTEDNNEWGALDRRAILWETVTAATLAQAGGSIFVLRHPESLRQFKDHISAMMNTNTY